MIIFTCIMCVDIYSFGKHMRSLAHRVSGIADRKVRIADIFAKHKTPDPLPFGPIGRCVLVALAVLLTVAWIGVWIAAMRVPTILKC